MKKILLIATATVLAASCQLPSQAQSPVQSQMQGKKNYIGPVVYFINGNSIFGAQAKIGIFDHVSVRPVIGFSGGSTAYNASATYDFNLSGQSPVQFEPFAGIGFVSLSGARSSTITYAQVGTDVGLGENIVLTGDLKFSLSGGSGVVAGVGTGLKF
jgi:hypothetical protein